MRTKASGAFPLPSSSETALVRPGERVSVFWDEDGKHYSGYVSVVKPGTKHVVGVYYDVNHSFEWVNLNKVKWKKLNSVN